jgi:hypothetical protein
MVPRHCTLPATCPSPRIFVESVIRSSIRKVSSSSHPLNSATRLSNMFVVSLYVHWSHVSALYCVLSPHILSFYQHPVTASSHYIHIQIHIHNLHSHLRYSQTRYSVLGSYPICTIRGRIPTTQYEGQQRNRPRIRTRAIQQEHNLRRHMVNTTYFQELLREQDRCQGHFLTQ